MNIFRSSICLSLMRTIILFFVLFFSGCVTQNKKIHTGLIGKVIGVTDGDTFKLLTEDKKQVKIRLYGIDCPEKKQDYGQVAKQKLSELIFNQYVTVEEKDSDRYGRKIAIVYNESGDCINEEMLKAGLAWHYKQYDGNADWARMEEQAKTAKLGIWSKHDAIAPWLWRKER